jgi:hypothetical protein
VPVNFARQGFLQPSGSSKLSGPGNGSHLRTQVLMGPICAAIVLSSELRPPLTAALGVSLLAIAAVAGSLPAAVVMERMRE